MGAYTYLNQFFPGGLVERAKQACYDKDNILILQGDEAALRTNYPQTYGNILSCKHQRDGRSPMEYARDLVASWLFEDFIIEKINESGMQTDAAGADKQRKILPGSKVSAASDFIVSYNGKKKQLELVNDYTGYWQEKGKMELRDDKYLKLANAGSLLLGVSLTNYSYFLLDFSKKISADYIKSHYPYGGKPAYSIPLGKNLLIPFTFSEFERVVDAIKCAMD